MVHRVRELLNKEGGAEEKLWKQRGTVEREERGKSAMQSTGGVEGPRA